MYLYESVKYNYSMENYYLFIFFDKNYFAGKEDCSVYVYFCQVPRKFSRHIERKANMVGLI